MKCKHCYKRTRDCPYYVAENDSCSFKKTKEEIYMESLEILRRLKVNEDDV